MQNNHVFDDIVEFPSSTTQEQFTNLVGLDDIKERLLKEVRLHLNPELLEKWSECYHKCLLPIVSYFHDRYPFFVFAG